MITAATPAEAERCRGKANSGLDRNYLLEPSLVPRRSPGLFSARFPCCACSLLSRPHHTGMHGGLILPPAHASRPCKGCLAPSQLSAQPEPHQLVKSHLLCKAGIQALLFINNSFLKVGGSNRAEENTQTRKMMEIIH